MPLWLLGIFDRWVGIALLYALAVPARIAALLVPSAHELKPRHIFLKMKGGGSLIIAQPSLLDLRRKHPHAEFILVCTQDAKAYAELTGLFDTYAVINDSDFRSLVTSGWDALRTSFRAAWCIDLEPNSILAAVFTMLTCARQRVGLVKQGQHARNVAYTSALSFNPTAPIYIYYDQIAETLDASPAPVDEGRAVLRALLPAPALARSAAKTVGLAAFTSDFARERMMPPQIWADLLKREFGDEEVRFLVFGSLRNKPMAQELVTIAQAALPRATFMNLCGDYALAQTSALIATCDEIWAVDSGLLHIARLLGIASHSFWGPTMPTQRLRPMLGLQEVVHYRRFICSPCVEVGASPPCGGHNLCMITMSEPNPNLTPSWKK